MINILFVMNNTQMFPFFLVVVQIPNFHPPTLLPKPSSFHFVYHLIHSSFSYSMVSKNTLSDENIFLVVGQKGWFSANSCLNHPHSISFLIVCFIQAPHIPWLAKIDWLTRIYWSEAWWQKNWFSSFRFRMHYTKSQFQLDKCIMSLKQDTRYIILKAPRNRFITSYWYPLSHLLLVLFLLDILAICLYIHYSIYEYVLPVWIQFIAGRPLFTDIDVSKIGLLYADHGFSSHHSVRWNPKFKSNMSPSF